MAFVVARPASTTRPWLHWATLALVLAFGIGARFYALDTSPPGLYYDEAFYALDAVEVRAGARPLYFEANNGREPLFIYSVALSQALLGETVYAVRVVAALYGALALVAGYGAARGLFGPRVAVLATALHAGSLWAILFSRIGLRVTTLPLVVGLLVATLVYGWRLRHRGLIVLGGAFLGLCFYTYIAARLIPLVFVGLAVFWFFFRRNTFPGREWLVLFGLSALAVATPMLVYAAGHWELYVGRAGQVALSSGDVVENLLRVAAMFVWRGDSNWRHNLAGRPIFDPLTAVAFSVGLLWLCWRTWRTRSLPATFVLLWLVVLALPTALSDQAPHYLRALGLSTLVYCVPALALEALEIGLLRTRAARFASGFGLAAAGALSLVHGGSTLLAWRDYTAATEPRYAFETAAVELAQAAQACATTSDGAAWVDGRMWERYPSIRYLAPSALPVEIEALPGVTAGQTTCVFTTGGEAAARVVAQWPTSVRLRAQPGGLDQTEGTPNPYPLYNALTIDEIVSGQVVTEFAEGPTLRLAEAARTAAGIRVRLIWEASRTLPDGLQGFIHLRLGEQMLAQWDGPLGGGLYPVEAWRAGDQVEQVVDLIVAEPAVATLTLGVYDFRSGTRLLTEAGLDQVTIAP